MANIFTCGLREKIKKKQGEVPKDLAEAIENLRRFPESKRICREAIQTAKRILHDEVRPCFLTRRAVVVWNECTPEQAGVEYRKERIIHIDNGYWLGSSFRFYPQIGRKYDKDEEDEICITLEGSLTDEGFFPLKPAEIEFLRNDRVLASYFFE